MIHNAKCIISIKLLLLLAINGFGQTQRTSGEIYEALDKFGVLANVLYIAAHPDDENTRMISYLSNELKANTRYLSLTRGDGGQNLIGPEIQELLGVIRTQELLAARKIDGGSQMFSRANDFGYSKNAEETIKIWDDEQVLSDVVWAIRTFKPDVIINRFDHRTSGKTHGHHTASAMLSYQAWDLVNDKTKFSDQLKHTDTWQPKRLFMNTSWWFYGSRQKFEEADKSNLMSADIGVYYPILGTSNNEIAARSRSMHVCQGMGSTPSRGSELEYFELLKGDMPSGKKDIFEGINTKWSRVIGGTAIEEKLEKVLADFDFRSPSKSVASLVEIRNMVSKIDDKYWKIQKLKELDLIIQDAAGLFMESTANSNAATQGETVQIETEIIKRLPANIKLVNLSITNTTVDTSLDIALASNEKVIFDHDVIISNDAQVTTPYWLQNKGTLGMYRVDDRLLIGKPETDRHLTAIYTLEIEGTKISFQRPIDYKYTDAEKGQVYQPFEILEPVYTQLNEDVYVFELGNAKNVSVNVKAMMDKLEGQVELIVPNDWQIEPKFHHVNIQNKGQEQSFSFKIIPPANVSTGVARPVVKIGNKMYSNRLHTIDYDHIPLQRVQLPAESKLVNIDIKKVGNNIAYIEGAGDAIPQSLRQIGYDVTVYEPKDITFDILTSYDAVILGVRAYNKWDEMKFKHESLMRYVEQGGTVIVQYNTSRDLVVDNIGPYPLKLGRERVSVEEAEVRILKPDHSLVNYPNKITKEDFEGWIQERGLYFAQEWDEKYDAILSCNDPGEKAMDGGLLSTQFGKGYFVFTGYSWFRELPAGVSGAYRIFANMISIGKEVRP